MFYVSHLFENLVPDLAALGLAILLLGAFGAVDRFLNFPPYVTRNRYPRQTIVIWFISVILFGIALWFSDSIYLGLGYFLSVLVVGILVWNVKRSE